ncbi:MAG: alpha/beta hydrolase [Parvularculaceae bacterium]
MKLLGRICLVVLVVLAGLAIIFWTPDTNKNEMIAKYGGPGATFATGVSGMQIHYRDQGPRDAPAMVLIHGSSSSLQTWEPLVDRLDQSFRVVSLDLPGHGLTGPHPQRDYSAAAMREAVFAVMDEVEISSAVWVGNSMGGWVSWQAGLSVPERIDAIVLLDPSGAPTQAKPPSNIGFRLMASPLGKVLAKKFTPRFLVAASIKQTVGDPKIVTELMIDRYWELLRFPGNRQATIDRAKIKRYSKQWDRLGTMSVPVLILWGAQDQVILVEDAVKFKTAIPDAQVIVYDGIGHLPMEEAPDLVARDIQSFLAQ